MEGALGVRLLTRTTRAVTLTDAGARFLAHGQRILAELAEAEAEARSESVQPLGRLSITAPVVFGRLHVAPLLARFLARHPGMTAELRLSDRWSGLVEEGLDLAVRIGQLPDSGLITRRLGETRRVLVAAPRYLAAHGTPRAPEALARHRVIFFGVADGTPEWRFATEGGERRLAVTPCLVTNNADAALAAAEQGMGLTMVLAYQAREALAAKRLVRVLRRHEAPAFPIQLAWPAGRHNPAKLRAFIAFAAEAADWRFA